MKRLFTLVLLQTILMSVFGVSQYTDRIVLNGEKLTLYSNPLETYFSHHPPKRPTVDIPLPELWRGYIATFNLKDKQLTINDILVQNQQHKGEGNTTGVWKSVVDSVFKNQNERFCDWYTGYLIIPTGKLLKKATTSYASLYEGFILLTVSTGKLIAEKKLTAKDYTAFLDSQFKSYSKTREYRQARKALPRLIKTSKEKDAFLKLFIDEYASRIYDK